MQAKVLFVLRDGNVTRWIPNGDDLTVETVNGLESVPYTGSDFWQEWKDENQLVDDDVVDALLLSDQVGAFGDLPKWLTKKGKSEWKMTELIKLAETPQYGGAALSLVDGERQLLLSKGDSGGALTLFLASTLSYQLPSQEDLEALREDSKAEGESKAPIEKPCIHADFLVDVKSKAIEAGLIIEGSVKAFSPFRGCFIDTSVADDQMRIRPTEYDKIDGLRDKLNQVGAKVTFKVKSAAENNGLIEISLEFRD